MDLYQSLAVLEAGLPHIEQSPQHQGTIELITCRPAVGERQLLDSAELDLEQGLLGDNWFQRGNRKTADGKAHPDMQLNLMNARVIGLIAKNTDRWPLAGDQFYVDLDLSDHNLPPGTRLALGEAIIEITAQPHLGCKKFAERFGMDAVKFVNSPLGKSLNLRGVNAKVIRPGKVTLNDNIEKILR